MVLNTYQSLIDKEMSAYEIMKSLNIAKKVKTKNKN